MWRARARRQWRWWCSADCYDKSIAENNFHPCVWSSTVKQASRQTGRQEKRTIRDFLLELRIFTFLFRKNNSFSSSLDLSGRKEVEKKNLHSFLSIWFTSFASELMRRSSTSMSLQAQAYFLICISSWRLERRMSTAKKRSIWYGRLAVINPVSNARLEDISDHCCFSFLLVFFFFVVVVMSRAGGDR